MDVGELYIAIEELILSFAKNQFRTNNIPASIGAIILKNVYTEALEDYIGESIQARIESGEGKDREPEEVITHGDTEQKG